MNIINFFTSSAPTFITKSFNNANKIVDSLRQSINDKISTHYFKLDSKSDSRSDIKVYDVFQFDNYAYPRFAPLKKELQGETMKTSTQLLANWNALWKLCFGESNSYNLKTIPFEKIYVLSDIKGTIGIAGFIRMNPHIIQVQSLAVHPLYRKCGYGTRILLEIVKDNPNTIILLGVLKEAPSWQHEYSKHGFRKVSDDDVSLLEDSGSWLISNYLKSETFLILNPYIKK